MSNVEVAAITITGQKHRHRGVPCEDASMAVNARGVSVVCVADGAGSKQYTHARFGSACAVKTICDLLTEHFDALYNENREAAVRALIIAQLHVKFAELIEEHQLDSLERLSCTLMFCAIKGRRMMIGHIGDGMIARISPSGISPITMPQNGSNASSTYFVTASHASDYLRFIKTTVDDVHAIALMTDGVQDSVYDENSGLVKPVVAKMAETLRGGRKKAETDLTKIVEKHIVGASNNSDDASFGVLLIEDTNGPDAGSLPVSADAFPSSTDTFKDLQNALIPSVKEAKRIISEALARKSVTGEGEPETVKKGENEKAAAETENKIPNVPVEAKKKNRILYGIVIVELILIFILVMKLLMT